MNNRFSKIILAGIIAGAMLSAPVYAQGGPEEHTGVHHEHKKGHHGHKHHGKHHHGKRHMHEDHK